MSIAIFFPFTLNAQNTGSPHRLHWLIPTILPPQLSYRYLQISLDSLSGRTYIVVMASTQTVYIWTLKTGEVVRVDGVLVAANEDLWATFDRWHCSWLEIVEVNS
jgi:hypothetical protein